MEGIITAFVQDGTQYYITIQPGDGTAFTTLSDFIVSLVSDIEERRRLSNSNHATSRP